MLQLRHFLGGKEDEPETERQKDRESQIRSARVEERTVRKMGRVEENVKGAREQTLRVLMDCRASVSGLLSQPEHG